MRSPAPLKADAVGLLLRTLRLATTRADGDALRDGWGLADHRGLDNLIDFEGCALWLSRRLRQIRANLGDRVTQLAHDLAARNLLVDAETETTLGHLAALDVPCILLKGAARRALAHELPFADARPTFDLDILVPAAAAPDVWHALRREGYLLVHPGRKPRPEHHHLPGLLGPVGVAVEIHTSVAPGISPEVSWERLRPTARRIHRFGVAIMVPSPTELLWDGMMHAVRGGARGFRLYQFLAASCIVASGGGAEAALQQIRARLAPTSAPPVALTSAWLAAATWLGGVGEDDPPAGLQRALQWRLTVARRLSPDHRALGAFADEASRLEFDLPPTRGVTRGLRPLGAVLVRNAYRCWRLARAS